MPSLSKSCVCGFCDSVTQRCKEAQFCASQTMQRRPRNTMAFACSQHCCAITAPVRKLAVILSACAGDGLYFGSALPPLSVICGRCLQVEGYSAAYDPEVMMFMDFRRFHSGLWAGAALQANVRFDALPCSLLISWQLRGANFKDTGTHCSVWWCPSCTCQLYAHTHCT